MNQTNIPFPLIIAAVISFMIMIPTSIATWWSRCFKLPLYMGFVILLSPVLISVITYYMPADDDTKDKIQSLIITVKLLAVIYGIVMQFTGNCSLGYNKGR